MGHKVFIDHIYNNVKFVLKHPLKMIGPPPTLSAKHIVTSLNVLAKINKSTIKPTHVYKDSHTLDLLAVTTELQFISRSQIASSSFIIAGCSLGPQNVTVSCVNQ